MPPKKKASNPKKKGKQKGGGGGSRPSKAENSGGGANEVSTAAADEDVITNLSSAEENVTTKLTLTKPTISIECANAFTSLFAADYPPKITIRLYVKNHLSKKERTLADKAYEECSMNFNKGIAQFHKMSENPSPENSRWHIAQVAFLDAIESAMRFPGVFLKTTVSVCVIHCACVNR
jgi:hypothetical protein